MSSTNFRDHLGTGEKSYEAVLQPGSRKNWILSRAISGPSCLFQEDEHQYGHGTIGSNAPPEFDRPIHVVNDESAESRPSKHAQHEVEGEKSESLASLVQEEHVGQQSNSNDRWCRSEQASEQTCDDKCLILIWVCHSRRPNAASERQNQTPHDH